MWQVGIGCIRQRGIDCVVDPLDLSQAEPILVLIQDDALQEVVLQYRNNQDWNVVEQPQRRNNRVEMAKRGYRQIPSPSDSFAPSEFRHAPSPSEANPRILVDELLSGATQE